MAKYTCAGCGIDQPEEQMEKIIREGGEGIVYRCPACGGRKKNGKPWVAPAAERRARKGNRKTFLDTFRFSVDDRLYPRTARRCMGPAIHKEVTKELAGEDDYDTAMDKLTWMELENPGSVYREMVDRKLLMDDGSPLTEREMALVTERPCAGCGDFHPPGEMELIAEHQPAAEPRGMIMTTGKIYICRECGRKGEDGRLEIQSHAERVARKGTMREAFLAEVSSQIGSLLVRWFPFHHDSEEHDAVKDVTGEEDYETARDKLAWMELENPGSWIRVMKERGHLDPYIERVKRYQANIAFARNASKKDAERYPGAFELLNLFFRPYGWPEEQLPNTEETDPAGLTVDGLLNRLQSLLWADPAVLVYEKGVTIPSYLSRLSLLLDRLAEKAGVDDPREALTGMAVKGKKDRRLMATRVLGKVARASDMDILVSLVESDDGDIRYAAAVSLVSPKLNTGKMNSGGDFPGGVTYISYYKNHVDREQEEKIYTEAEKLWEKYLPLLSDPVKSKEAERTLVSMGQQLWQEFFLRYTEKREEPRLVAELHKALKTIENPDKVTTRFVELLGDAREGTANKLWMLACEEKRMRKREKEKSGEKPVK